jgi:hypothetical protein
VDGGRREPGHGRRPPGHTRAPAGGSMRGSSAVMLGVKAVLQAIVQWRANRLPVFLHTRRFCGASLNMVFLV